MTTTLAGIVLIGGFVLLMILRTPVSFAMLAATLGSALITGTNFSVMVRQMVDGANNFSLLSIPFFIVMGEFMSAGGISEKIVDLANLAVGRFRGGLGTAMSIILFAVIMIVTFLFQRVAKEDKTV